jgi:hypothetical protein
VMDIYVRLVVHPTLQCGVPSQFLNSTTSSTTM